MTNDSDDWTKHIKNERLTKSFTIDVETLGKVKQFIQDYNGRNFSNAIDDLVNVGLTCLGYRTKEELDKKFKNIDFENTDIDVPKEDDFDINIIAPRLSTNQHENMRAIVDSIKLLCSRNENGCAPKQDIIIEAEAHGLDEEIILECINRLKRNGQVFEPIKGQYKLTVDY